VSYAVAADASDRPRLRSPAHGFCDDEESRRLLRSRPPDRALRWVESQTGCQVVSARALRGGMSSAVHDVTVADRAGHRVQVVLRRYVRPELNAEEPDLAEREARALRYVESLTVPTPGLIAVDGSGTEAGVPTLVMTRLPGKVDWWPPDIERWLRGLVEVCPRSAAPRWPRQGCSRPTPRIARRATSPRPGLAGHECGNERSIWPSARPPNCRPC
jgi:hypothetical protein